MYYIGFSKSRTKRLYRCLFVNSTFFRLAGKIIYRDILMSDYNFLLILRGFDVEGPTIFDTEDSAQASPTTGVERRGTINFKKYLLAQVEEIQLEPHMNCDECQDFPLGIFKSLQVLQIIICREPSGTGWCCDHYSTCRHHYGTCPVVAACNPRSLVIRNLGRSGLPFENKPRYSPSNLQAVTYVFPPDGRFDYTIDDTWALLVELARLAQYVTVIFAPDCDDPSMNYSASPSYTDSEDTEPWQLEVDHLVSRFEMLAAEGKSVFFVGVEDTSLNNEEYQDLYDRLPKIGAGKNAKHFALMQSEAHFHANIFRAMTSDELYDRYIERRNIKNRKKRAITATQARKAKERKKRMIRMRRVRRKHARGGKRQRRG